MPGASDRLSNRISAIVSSRFRTLLSDFLSQIFYLSI